MGQKKMKTRMKKWAHYRAKIIDTPDSKFGKRKNLELSTSKEDEAMINRTAPSKGAISMEDLGAKKRHSTPYRIYRKRKTMWLVGKCFLLALTLGGFAAWFFLWVK